MTTNNSVLFNDPLFNQQWYLHNHGQNGGTPGLDLNVLPVWQDYSGAGVRLAVVDDGISYNHIDLDDNYDGSVDYDADAETDDAAPVSDFDNHGTAVAGIIGAEANNGRGGMGIAFGSTISGIRLNFEKDDGPRQDLNALAQMSNFDVANNSWGYVDLFADNFLDADFANHDAAVRNVVETGRNGLGTAIVFAAGNGRMDGDDANAHNMGNNRYVISVAALNHTGTHTRYSNPGANLLVSAFGAESLVDGIVTTDREGTAGYTEDDYTPRFGGTSAAAPMVSGVVALMLEANPELGYRDIQEILAYSARQVDTSNRGWQFNGATNWNGGGLHTSRDYGFGLVDAHAAVRLAETWTQQRTAYNEQSLEAFQGLPTQIIDQQDASSEVTLTQELTIGHVAVEVNIEHGRIGDLELILVSPSGTESVLMARPGRTDDNPNGLERRDLRFTFGSTQFWGEDAAGTWTLRVRDRATGEEGVLQDWSLRVYGDQPLGDDTYIYTNEFARFGTETGRNLLQDSFGYDTLNAAAVTRDLTIDLAPGQASKIAGRTLTIEQGSVIEAAIAGDGNDLVSGNGADNGLYGMRGNDVMRGLDGDDWLAGWRGDDWLSGGSGDDMLVGGDGRDSFYFSGRSLGHDTILDFDAAADRVVLEMNTFSALSNGSGRRFAMVANDFEAANSDGVIVYSQSSGHLFYNTNGTASGMGEGGHFATLRGTPNLTDANFLVV